MSRAVVANAVVAKFRSVEMAFYRRSQSDVSRLLCDISMLTTFPCSGKCFSHRCWKVPSRFCKKNCHPISLTSSVYKAFEVIFADALLDHFTRHNILDPGKFDFLSSRTMFSTGFLLRWLDYRVEYENSNDVIHIGCAKLVAPLAMKSYCEGWKLI